MTRRSGSMLGAGIVVLTLAVAACGYDSSSNTGPGYGDNTPTTGPGGYAVSAGADRSQFRVFTATGDITETVAGFRAALGDPHREIKWDGAPADMPGDFFNTTVKAGAIFSTDGTGFHNSATNFDEINPNYADEFKAFSAPKTFMPLGSATLTTTFRVPGTETRASTRGFGLVFSDVEREGSASIMLLDAEGRSLGRYNAPVRSDANGFSFVGVVFASPIVAEVRITSGQAALGADVQDLSDGGNRDLVVMDDYLYGEPQEIR